MHLFLGACDSRMVAELVALEIRRGCQPQQETGKANTLFQRLKKVMRCLRLSTPNLAVFTERVKGAMQAVTNCIDTFASDTRHITAGAILGALRAARAYNLPEHIALEGASHALIGQIDKTRGDLTQTALGIVEGAIENATLAHRSVPIAISSAIWAVSESVLQCDGDSLRNVARGIARFVHVQADHFVIKTCFPMTARPGLVAEQGRTP